MIYKIVNKTNSKYLILTALVCYLSITLLYAAPSPSDAFPKAQEAFLIQSGLNGQLEALAKGLEREGLYRADQLSIKAPILALGAFTRVYKSKSIQFRLMSDKELRITPDSVNLTIHF